MNQELLTLFEADQQDRQNGPHPSLLERDQDRRQLLENLIEVGSLLGGEDYFHAAVILHHSDDPNHIQQAYNLALRAVELDYRPARWLAAASLDRWLLRQGQPQKYGTQYRIDRSGHWQLQPVDPTTTDEERQAWDVPTLAVAQNQAETLNSSSSSSRPTTKENLNSNLTNNHNHNFDNDKEATLPDETVLAELRLPQTHLWVRIIQPSNQLESIFRKAFPGPAVIPIDQKRLVRISPPPTPEPITDTDFEELPFPVSLLKEVRGIPTDATLGRWDKGYCLVGVNGNPLLAWRPLQLGPEQAFNFNFNLSGKVTNDGQPITIPALKAVSLTPSGQAAILLDLNPLVKIDKVRLLLLRTESQSLWLMRATNLDEEHLINFASRMFEYL